MCSSRFGKRCLIIQQVRLKLQSGPELIDWRAVAACYLALRLGRDGGVCPLPASPTHSGRVGRLWLPVILWTCFPLEVQSAAAYTAEALEGYSCRLHEWQPATIGSWCCQLTAVEVHSDSDLNSKLALHVGSVHFIAVFVLLLLQQQQQLMLQCPTAERELGCCK